MQENLSVWLEIQIPGQKDSSENMFPLEELFLLPTVGETTILPQETKILLWVFLYLESSFQPHRTYIPLATKENSFTKAFFFRVLKKISLYESNEGFFFNQ